MASTAVEVGPQENRLLLALPERDRSRVLAGGRRVDLALSDVLYRPGEAIRSIYFPGGALVSLVIAVEREAGLEVGLVGPEGMTGISVLLGNGVSTGCAVCQGAGAAIQVDAQVLQREFVRSDKLQRLVHLHASFALTQLARIAACNSFHPVEARMVRWMLMVHDRIDSDEFRITQEFIAQMLGVRREAVSSAAGALQEQGLLRCRRGRVNLLDHKGLQARACSCYVQIKREYDELVLQFGSAAT